MSDQDTERERRRRVAEIFGDVLPDTTSDERDDRDAAAGSGGADGSDGADGERDRWLRSQVPPHHG